jgi:hypothetical protein
MLNAKLETLPPKADPLFAENSKQTQMSLHQTQTLMTFWILYFGFV